MPDIGTMHQLNPEPPHIGTMHQLGPEPLHTGEIITPQAQAEEYAREAQESADNAALSAAAAQSAAETAQQAAESIAPALDEKADAIHTAAGPAPIVSIPDAAAAPVDALTVGIEPVQDLHGYDNPWPAGGGKNIFYHEGNLTATANGLTATFDGASQTVSITGTNTGTSAYVLLNMACTGDIPRETPLARALINAPSGVYANFVYRKNRTWVSVNNGGVIPVDIDEGTDITFQIGILTSVTTLNANGIHVQIERGSTAPTSWTPYSNICPITGWTGAKVTRTGTNLLPTTASGRTYGGITYTVNSDGSIHVEGTATSTSWLNASAPKTFIKAGTYTLSGGATNCGLYIVGEFMNGGNINNVTIGGADNGSGKTFTLADDANVYYQLSVSNGRVIDTVIYPRLTVGSSIAEFATYNGTTYPITFPSEAGTVYGGSLNVTTGVLTVDRAMVDLGTLTWNKITTTGTHWRFWAYLNAMAYNGEMLSSQYKHITSSQQYLGEIGIASQSSGGNYLAMVSDERFSDAATFKTAMSGVQLVYELATPITYTLTPQEIRTLLGNNNIWADTGDVTVGYKADTKLYIDKKFAELQALILEN